MSDSMPQDASTILGALRAYLVAVAQIAALMGQGYEARIRPEQIPLNTPYRVGSPHLVYQRLGTRDIRTLRGTTQNLHPSTVQVDVWSKDAQERDNLAQAVRLAMRPERFRGRWNGLEIRDVEKDFDGDTSSSAQDGSEEIDWRTTFRFTVWHRNLTEV